MTPSRIRFIVRFIAFFDLFSTVFGQQQYSRNYPCLQKESDLVVLWKDPLSGSFSVVQRMSGNESHSVPGANYRVLRKSDLLLDSGLSDAERHGLLRSEIDATPGVLAVDAAGLNIVQRLMAEERMDRTEDALPVTAVVESDELYYAWECGCHHDNFRSIPTVYCPLDIDTCLRPSRGRSGALPGCRNLPTAYDFRRYYFLFIMAWFLLLLIVVSTTSMGSNLCGYIISKYRARWNERAIDRLIDRHPERVRSMLRMFLVRQHRAREEARSQMVDTQATQAVGDAGAEGVTGNGDGLRRENEAVAVDAAKAKRIACRLLLRTKVYRCNQHPPTMENNQRDEHDDLSSETDEVDCAICFTLFADGDRVGSLKCGHLFHKECIKLWLQRKNACPLCNTEGIAEPRYDEVGSDTEAASDESENTLTSHSEETQSSDDDPSSST